MARHALWAIALVMGLSSAARAQQSWGERCNSLPRGSDPGMVEFCQGIAAATGYNSNGKRDEEAALQSVGLRWIPEPAPTGTLFHNSQERVAYVQRMAHGEIEAKRRAMWDNANQDFQSCRNRGGDNCQPPLGPRPQ